MNSYAILFDLDGTLSDHSRRLPLLQTTNHPDWEKFFEDCDQDESMIPVAIIYNPICSMAQHLQEAGRMGKAHDVPFVDIITGRPEKLRAKTIRWLQDHALLMPRNLHMRPEGDLRPDNVLKLDMYQQFYRMKDEEVLVVFEDRQRVVEAWRNAGVKCFQVSEGKF